MFEKTQEFYRKADNQYKLVAFSKTESRPFIELDPNDNKKSRVKFREQPHALFCQGGEVKINNCQRYEVLGFIDTVIQAKIWRTLLDSLKDFHDSEIREGVSVESDQFKGYTFLLRGFDNKEDVIGSIQSSYGLWNDRLKRIRNRLSPKINTQGDDYREAMK